MKKELATKVYNQLIKDLHSLILNHQSPDGKGGTKPGITAFAEAYGFGRQNLQKVFTLGTNSISLGIYLKILVSLGLLEKEATEGLEPQEYTISLRAILLLDMQLLVGTTTLVHLATLPEPAPDHV